MMRDDSDLGALLPDATGELLFLLAVGVIVLAGAQGLVEQLLAGGPADVSEILEWRITPVLIWIAAAPLLLGIARTLHRATRGSLPRLLAAHSVVVAVWIVLSNVLMRVPGALRGEPLELVLPDALRGAVEYGPAAAVVYAALVAVDQSRESGARREASRSAAVPKPDSSPGLLAVRDGVRIHMVNRPEIRWVEADGDYVQIHTAEKSYRTRGTLTAYERELEVDGFLRVHRSALVHPRAIREIQSFYRGDHVAILRDGSEIRIPRTREDVLAVLLAPTVEG